MAKRLLLICGVSTGGKTSSLSGLQNQEKVLYLNAESAKGGNLPFRNKFMKKVITEPMAEILGEGGYLNQCKNNPSKVDTVVIDSLTFLMEMYETRYINTAADTRKAWGGYSDFFKNLMNQSIATIPQNVILTAHVSDVYNDKDLCLETKIKLKGSLMNNGIEAYFNDIVSAKRVNIKTLANYENDLLHISDEEKELGFKHVLQTRLTKDTCFERIRSNVDMWKKNETFIDCNAQLVLDRLNEYYGE